MKASILLRIKVIPGSSRTEFIAFMDDGSYKIRLKAAPVHGKANAELLRWLSKQFAVGRDTLLIKSGSTSRRKTVRINSPFRTPGWFHG
ncbi:MAG: DUF167 domain-containing protein [Candidatus Sabulitectum sp.]|nr:DUF167 domain-containing protein [Candidatus Sabulitectum sp.]